MKKLFCLLVLVSVISGSAVADVLASVDSRELSWEELVELVGGPEVISSLGISTEAAAADLLDTWIIEQIVLSAAEESDVASRPDVAAIIEQTVNQIIVEAYITDIIDDLEVSRLEIENYIDVWSETYTMKYNVRHILLPDPVIASSVLSRLNSGESFATLASQFSVGPSASSGGDLGWMTRGMISRDFMEAVCRLSSGEISDIVETSMGFHIIQLMDKAPLDNPITPEETIEIATMELLSSKQEELLIQLIEDLRGDHLVNAWPERLLNHI
ncbi:MAG: peptidylprolyl isomerase [Candidatus Fermentibacteria bacterium]|nr:peptidylprolyl isomerase [Candidatus Fermentibacteria bacterium]